MPRPYIPNLLRRLVRERARSLCEYCLLHEDDTPDAHQFDHILAVRHNGQTTSENLAYACAMCNHFKGTDFGTIDPASGLVVWFFNPRTQEWRDHFVLMGARIVGLTPTSLATVALLHLNDEDRLLEREVLIAQGRYPRDDE
jgi:hypothetical protein